MVELLECRNISKAFENVPVLNNISLGFRPGSVTVLAGENGAGKSTLLNIIAGELIPDKGSILIEGRKVNATERLANVAIVPQELSPVPEMTVYENIFLGREYRTRMRFLARNGMIQEAKRLLLEFDIPVSPIQTVKSLSIAQMQLLEIVKAVNKGARIILMDEPTSSIGDKEWKMLRSTVHKLRANGHSIIYTTHKMDEIFEIADVIAVMRDGQLISMDPVDKFTPQRIIVEMVGRNLDNLFPDEPSAVQEDVVLTLKNFKVVGLPGTFNVSIRKGEIVGLAGLVGAGRTALLEGVFGLRGSSGEIVLNSRQFRKPTPAALIDAGVAYVTEDRKISGIVPWLSWVDNAALPFMKSLTRRGLIHHKDIQRKVVEVLRDVNVHYSSENQLIAHLSGGNQQKVLIGRWLLNEHLSVMLLDEPTRGIDIGARSEIYSVIRHLTERGIGILLVSSDLPELINLCDEISVFRDGQTVGNFTKEEFEQEEIIKLAVGEGGIS